MKIFNKFDPNSTEKFFCCPLSHPNIDYEWIQHDFKIENKIYPIITIGRIIATPKISLLKFEKIDLGFFDDNKNFITPILFNTPNLRKKQYRVLLNKIENKINISDEKKANQNIMNELKENLEFKQDVIKYIKQGVFQPNYETDFTIKDIDNLISIIKQDSEELLKKYPHLKHLDNTLRNL